MNYHNSRKTLPLSRTMQLMQPQQFTYISARKILFALSIASLVFLASLIIAQTSADQMSQVLLRQYGEKQPSRQDLSLLEGEYRKADTAFNGLTLTTLVLLGSAFMYSWNEKSQTSA